MEEPPAGQEFSRRCFAMFSVIPIEFHLFFVDFLDFQWLSLVSMHFHCFSRNLIGWHWFSWISIDFRWFPWIFIDFHKFSWIFMDSLTILEHFASFPRVDRSPIATQNHNYLSVRAGERSFRRDVCFVGKIAHVIRDLCTCFCADRGSRMGRSGVECDRGGGEKALIKHRQA